MKNAKCPNCGKHFQSEKYTAVYIGGIEYCQPSCANAGRGVPSYKPPQSADDDMWDTFMG